MRESANQSRLGFGARVVLLALVFIAFARSHTTAQQGAAAAPLTADEASAIATDAYIYGYPLVTVEMTRRVVTNIAAPSGLHAPVGQFARSKEYPTTAFKDVTAPNVDTLYSSAFLDLSKEPYVLSIPDADGRYFAFSMLDGWTTVFQVPGKRTTGTKAQKYAIAGPGWSGTLPDGVTEYKSPTNMVWIIGRIYCSGTPADYKAVHALQDKLGLVPLSAYGKRYTPPAGTVDKSIDMDRPVRDQVNKLDAGAYFKLLASLMKDNPATPEDAPIVAQMAKIGLVPGQDFDLSKLDPSVAKALADVPKAGQQKIAGYMTKAGRVENGWVIFGKTGIYGTDYLDRATVTWYSLGANRPQDAIYPTSESSAQGKPYDGANKYVLHFDKGEPLPPVNGFWSLTMYDAQYFFVANPLNRYPSSRGGRSLSQRNTLKHNADGSVDLYIQNESPGAAKESNWLPVPKGRFVLMLRLYWPKETPPSIIDDTWKPPAVEVAP
jgi:hypothetical protein